MTNIRITTLLSAVLLDRPKPITDDQHSDNPQSVVLKAYTSRQYIIVTGNITGTAEAVVVVAGPPYVDREAGKKNAAVLTMVTGLDQKVPIVVAGAGAGGDGNVLAQLRGDPTLTKSVSTVDNVSTEQGRVVTSLALAEQFEGRTGHYGIDAGATALLPKPANADHNG